MFGKQVSAGPPSNSGGILTDFAACLPVYHPWFIL